MSKYVHSAFFFVSLDARKAVALYDSYQLTLDDVIHETDRLDGLFLRLMLPDLFQFYGPYIQTTLFHSYPGSLNYLSYMRQIGAQDPIQVAICLPESEFPQKDYLPMIVTLKAELEDFGSKLKNLFSFYKESDTAIDRINYPSTKPRGPVVRCWRFSIACHERIFVILESTGDTRLAQRIRDFSRARRSIISLVVGIGFYMQ
ncbi:hypothetical protein MW887_000715 [Aspergillus wentii]|nr:hypothetical protein MW887_000715 [Aspergillus wentii]